MDQTETTLLLGLCVLILAVVIAAVVITRVEDHQDQLDRDEDFDPFDYSHH